MITFKEFLKLENQKLDKDKKDKSDKKNPFDDEEASIPEKAKKEPIDVYD